MVSFAEQGQDVNPANTSFWARPIEQPKSDVSKGITYKAIGSALGEGIKFADQYAREGIVAPTTANEAGALRDQFVDALNTARESVEPQPLGAPKSLSAGEQKQLPQNIQNVGQKVDMLQKAMESGRLSETDYYGRVNALAKQLRSQFPGYRDEVDREIARVTGVHPANQYIRGMIGDMNHLISQHTQSKDRFEAQLEYAAKEQIVSPAEIKMLTEKHNNNEIDENYILGLIASRRSRKAQQEDAAFEWRKQDEDAKHAGIRAERDITRIGYDLQQTALETEEFATGMYKGQKTQDVLTAVGQGRITISDEDYTNLAQQETIQYGLLRAQVKKRITQPLPGVYDEEGKPMSLADQARRSGRNVEELVDASLKDYKDRMETTAGKSFELRHMSKMLTEARLNDVHNYATKDPYVAATLGNAKLIKDNMGDQTFNTFITQHQDMSDKLDKSLRQLFDEDTLAGYAQPRKRAGGEAYEFIRHVQDAQNKGVSDGDFYKLLLQGAGKITNKDTDPSTRENLIDYYFGPNAGQLVTTATKGKDDVYAALYTPLMARTIAKNNPDKYATFDMGAEQNARALFTESINTLKNIISTESPTAMGKYKGEAPLTLHWYGDHFEASGPNAAYYRSHVDRLNTMVTGLKSVYDYAPQKNENADVETFMFGRLVEMGFDPRKNVTGVPSQIMNALMAHKGAAGATEKPAGASKGEE